MKSVEEILQAASKEKQRKQLAAKLTSHLLYMLNIQPWDSSLVFVLSDGSTNNNREAITFWLLELDDIETWECEDLERKLMSTIDYP